MGILKILPELCGWSVDKKPNDFIVGTGKLHSVEDFVKLAFKHVNLNYKKYLKIDANFKRKR